uniref:Uncharacterized protein n=1 Tax=Acrobeloides nanus TaxID=290746 RepID=A0A914E8K0_9BILA
MLGAKNLISNISGNLAKTLVKNEAPLMASTSSANSHENRMYFRASSAQHLNNSNASPFAKIQLEKSFHTTATAERKYDHHFVEDSYCLEQEDQGRF